MDEKKQEPQRTDPVCGMAVSPSTAAATAEHEGKTYYFCHKSCRDKFQARPEQYVRNRAKA